MSAEENKKTAHRIYEEIWSEGNLNLIPELISSGYDSGPFKGIAGFRKMVENARAAFPELKYTIDDIVGEGDKLALRLTFNATFKNKYGDTEPTGKPVKYSHALFTRYEDGKVVEAIPFTDRLTVNQQLGRI